MEPRAIYRCIAEQPLVDNELCQWNPHSTRRTRGLQEYLLQSGWWKPVKGLEVPQVQVMERVVEVPDIQTRVVIKQVPKVQAMEVVKEVPKVSIQAGHVDEGGSHVTNGTVISILRMLRAASCMEGISEDRHRAGIKAALEGGVPLGEIQKIFPWFGHGQF